MNLGEHDREFDKSDNAAVTESSIGFFICAINAPMCLALLFGNAAVLTTICRTLSLHILLSSLALTDFAVGLVVQPLFIHISPNCKLWWVASFLPSNSHRLPIHSLVPVWCFIPYIHSNNSWSLSRLQASLEVSRRCNAYKGCLGGSINLDSQRMYFQHEIMEQDCVLLHYGCHDPALSPRVVCHLLAYISCYSKTSDTNSLPRISARALKTAPDDVIVEKVDLKHVLCLLHFLFVLHSACFFHRCLVRNGKMVVSHCCNW